MFGAVVLYSATMDSRKLSELRAFVRLCKQNPGLLHTEELGFLREWVERSVMGDRGERGWGGRARPLAGGGGGRHVAARGPAAWLGRGAEGARCSRRGFESRRGTRSGTDPCVPEAGGRSESVC